MSTYGDSAKTKTITRRKYARIVALLRANDNKDNHQTNSASSNGGSGTSSGSGEGSSAHYTFI